MDGSRDGFEPVDQAQATVFLTDRFGDTVTEATPLGAGAWSRAFAFQQAGQDRVIRFGAHVQDFAKDRRAARFNSPTLPIPQVDEIGEAYGGYYALSERRYGSYIDDVDGVQLRALLPALFAALDAIRQADVSDTTGYGVWGADGHAPHPSWGEALLDVGEDRPGKRIYGWRARLAASPVGVEPFEEAYRRLQALVDRCPEPRHLIHSDLLHFNVLVAGARITALLDWGSALYGDFLYDLAWLIFWQSWYPAWQAIDVRVEAERHFAEIGLAVPALDERLRACQIHIGLDGLAYQAWAGDWQHLPQTASQVLGVARSHR